jgi:hypothetical protein
MSADLIQRYQPGGDIYAALLSQFGKASADAIAAAALTGDETAINAAYTQAKFGEPLNDSTASIFISQLETDPFAAPAAALNSGLKTAIDSAVAGIFKNPYVLAAVVAGIALTVYNLGGFTKIFNTLKTKIK